MIHPKTRGLARRNALTLLEVLVSLAIFFMSIIAISALVDMAKDKAAEAEYRSISLLVAESKLAELKSGVGALQGGSGNWETDENFTWEVSVTSTGASLYQVNVSAQRQGYPHSRVDLAQYIMDPQSLGSTMDTIPDPSMTEDTTGTGSAAAGGGGAAGSGGASSGSGSTSQGANTKSSSSSGSGSKTSGGTSGGAKTGGGASLFGGSGGSKSGGSSGGSKTGGSTGGSRSGGSKSGG